ncbi:MAG: hypothetical protein IJ419_07990 [Agathobacter sp.]|nr:hypothetical protein [Agathobacter sp.]
MKMTLLYDENNKRLILKRETNEWINTSELKQRGIHWALINGNYELVIYIDAITQKRLDKIHNYVNQHHWEIIFNNNFFTRISHNREWDNASYDEKIEYLFSQSTYDCQNKHFVEWQKSIAFSSISDSDIEKEYARKIRTDISNTLSRMLFAKTDSIVDQALSFTTENLIRELIDDACETARRNSYQYDIPIQALYDKYKNELFAPLDWIIRKSYIKIAIKNKYNLRNCAPASISTESVIKYLNQEINNGWNKNPAVVALSHLLNVLTCPPIDKPLIYKAIKTKAFKTESELEQSLYTQFQLSTEKEQQQAQYLFDPIIIKHREY